MRKILAAGFLFLFVGIAQAAAQGPTAQGKWAFNFAHGRTITFAAVNIVQDAQANLSSPWFAGTVGDNVYQNFEAFSDSTCSPSGWAPVEPVGTNANGAFTFRLYVDTGTFYDLAGTLTASASGIALTGSYTSNCSGDHGLFTGTLYAPANKSYVGVINGTRDDGTNTQFAGTLTLAEDAQFNVTGSLTFNTRTGTSSCYGTVHLSGPATGDFIELGGANASVENVGILVVAATPDFSAVKLQSMQIASLACGNGQAQGSFTSKAPKPHASPRR